MSRLWGRERAQRERCKCGLIPASPGCYPSLTDEETTVRGRATFAQRSHNKELGFQAVSLSYLKGKKKNKKNLFLLLSDFLFPCTDTETCTVLPCPPMPLLLAMSAAPHGGRALEGMGRGRKPKEATESKHAWAGGRVRHQPGPGCVLPKLGAQKLLLFTPQLCPSRRQSRVCPGLGLGFSTRWARGLTRRA